jgi:hypothetical protein
MNRDRILRLITVLGSMTVFMVSGGLGRPQDSLGGQAAPGRVATQPPQQQQPQTSEGQQRRWRAPQPPPQQDPPASLNRPQDPHVPPPQRPGLSPQPSGHHR